MTKNKVTQKLERHVRSAITLATESTADIDGIHYSVDWSNFPNSLMLNCQLHSDGKPDTPQATIIQQDRSTKKIQSCFLKQGIRFRDIRKNIEFNLHKKND
jgi:hypothetical protein